MTERQADWSPEGKPWLAGLAGYVGQPMPYEEYDPDFLPAEVEEQMASEDRVWEQLAAKRQREAEAAKDARKGK